MNLPNKLTIFRVILVIPFVALMLNGYDLWAVAVFIIARITDFGKFMDPLADKLLVCAAMICLVEMGRLPAWMVIVIISREFIISGFRLVASDNGVVIAASYWGKFKTTFQMLMIIVLILNLGGVFDMIGLVLTWIALILTVVSLIDYLVKNKQVILEGEI